MFCRFRVANLNKNDTTNVQKDFRFTYSMTWESWYDIQLWATNPFLRTTCTPIAKINTDILNFAEVLVDMMWELDGVWLAAPQIWNPIRMFAITYREKGKDWLECVWDDVFINPTIIKKSKETSIAEEWCLSLPQAFGDVERHKKITVHTLMSLEIHLQKIFHDLTQGLYNMKWTTWTEYSL